MNVPLIDLKAQHAPLADQIAAATLRVIHNTDFILGSDVAAFEEEFAAFCGTSFAVGVANGTDAIHLACRALGIGAGDEVITVANTFIATLIGIQLAGARPVLVDCNESDFLIDINRIEAAITPRTRAIAIVHLYGQCVEMEPVLALARRHNLRVIEDSAQAHGAVWNGKRAGSFGDIGCFSFYPSKNLGACGDGGICVTGSAELRDRLRLLRNWGSTIKYHHDIFGFNSRLDTLQAAILRIKLPHLNSWNTARQRIATDFERQLAAIPQVRPPRPGEPGRHVFHLYVVRVPDRDRVLQELQKAGVGAGIHYPIPPHLSPAFASLGYGRGSFPVAEKLAGEILSLPMFPELTPDQTEHIFHALLKATITPCNP